MDIEWPEANCRRLSQGRPIVSFVSEGLTPRLSQAIKPKKKTNARDILAIQAWQPLAARRRSSSGQRCSVLQAVDAGGMRRSLQPMLEAPGFLATKHRTTFSSRAARASCTTLAQNDEPKTA